VASNRASSWPKLTFETGLSATWTLRSSGTSFRSLASLGSVTWALRMYWVSASRIMQKLSWASRRADLRGPEAASAEE